jgi:putative protease
MRLLVRLSNTKGRELKAKREAQIAHRNDLHFAISNLQSKMPKKATEKKEKPIGVVTHFYSGISVAIIKFNKAVKKGTEIRFKGATTDFSQTIGSIQYDHKDIESAKKGQEVGIKVDEKVREGDEVYEVKE